MEYSFDINNRAFKAIKKKKKSRDKSNKGWRKSFWLFKLKRKWYY